MVEKIIINPNKVRGYGNIMMSHSSSDYELEDCTISTGTDTVNGATETVYTLTSTASHSYSLSFGSASYTAVGGACTVTVTLTDGGVAVNNATISVSGGSGGSGTGTTNSSGVATINVTGITANGTLTASFSGATATASVTYQQYIFYDSCASDNTSQYTNFYEIWASQSTIRTSLTFDTDHYVLSNSNGSFSAVCLPVTAGLDDWKLTAKIRLLTNSSNKGGGVGVVTQKEKGIAIFQPNGTTSHLLLNNYVGAITSNVSVSNLSTSDYNTFELTKEGASLTFKIYDANNTQRFSKEVTISESTYYPNCIPCISVGQSDSVYVKEIKVESL